MHEQCTCPTCGASFVRARTSNRRYCSTGCRPTTADRFWAKVDKNGPEHAQRPDLGRCWLWLGTIGSHGYGGFWGSGRRFGGGEGGTLAHLWAYRELVGPIPEGMKADHLCHTFDPDCPGDRCRHRRCVNPSHIEPVTEATNIRRGQSPYGKKYRQTHCLRGHQDWHVKPSGRRQCRACDLERQRAKSGSALTGPSRQAPRDTCLRGHRDFVVRPSGDRVCRSCDVERKRAAYLKRTAQP